MKLPLLRIFISAIIAVIVSAAPQEMPSPSSYSRIAAATVPSDFRSTVDIQPTPIPELRRQLKRQTSDSLGWNNPSTCNIGVCAAFDICTVFTSDGLRANTATGMCCESVGACSSFHVCIDYSSHSFSTLSAGAVQSGTGYCGTSYPYCRSTYYGYGWGSGTFLYIACGKISSAALSTLNPSWKLYVDETNPGKGPMSTITINPQTNVSSPPSIGATLTPTSTPIPYKLSAGAIAGIVIGSIVIIALSVVGIMVVQSRLRRSDQMQPGIAPFQEKEVVPPYHNNVHQSAAYPSARQPGPEVGY
ncbi:hypothetical protein BDD12DRAFT_839282 [Trichophaea hybrida]|nr:hypothetical protein BDD12DRAFT_839282 [Trichophaea hybrida]